MCGFLVIGSDQVKYKDFKNGLKNIERRGPDETNSVMFGNRYWGFNRLSIMDLSLNGMQPFTYQNCILVCNGEIYNYLALKENLINNYTFFSASDCEVLLPLYLKYELDVMVRMLDGEFAFVLYNKDKGQMAAARDPMGIRPMFYGYTKVDHQISFASEAKALMPVCDEIYPFPPGYYYQNGKFVCYNDLSEVKTVNTDSLEKIALFLRFKLEKAVEKRLQSDAPIGYLLSGGLDSSLVCAIASRLHNHPIRT